MKNYLFIGLALSAIGCSGGAVAEKVGLVEAPLTQQPDGFVMVESGKVSEAQLVRFLYLQFPQSAEAIESVLGIPYLRDDAADYYRLQNGKNLTVYYADGKAVRFSIGESK